MHARSVTSHTQQEPRKQKAVSASRIPHARHTHSARVTDVLPKQSLPDASRGVMRNVWEALRQEMFRKRVR